MTIANTENQDLAPMVLEAGKSAANALMEIVRHTKSPIVVNISGNEYLKVEAWEFIGKANNTFAAVKWVAPITEDNEVVAYEAQVDLMCDGQVVGSAISECGLDSFVTRGAQGRDKHNAAKSMAQTRATSKAFRMSFSWVATLAGYEATTAEEMQAVRPQGQTPSGQQQRPSSPANPNLMCPEHNEEWFKKGNMRGYAHKIGETNKWCNMPKLEEATETPLKATPATIDAQAMTSRDFVTGYEQMGLDAKTVREILGDTKEVQARLDAGDTWEDLLAAVKNAIQPGPPEDEQEELFPEDGEKSGAS